MGFLPLSSGSSLSTRTQFPAMRSFSRGPMPALSCGHRFLSPLSYLLTIIHAGSVPVESMSYSTRFLTIVAFVRSCTGCTTEVEARRLSTGDQLRPSRALTRLIPSLTSSALWSPTKASRLSRCLEAT